MGHRTCCCPDARGEGKNRSLPQLISTVQGHQSLRVQSWLCVSSSLLLAYHCFGQSFCVCTKGWCLFVSISPSGARAVCHSLDTSAHTRSLHEKASPCIRVCKGLWGYPPWLLCLGLQPVLCFRPSALSLVAPRHFLPASPFCQASLMYHCDSTQNLLTQ